MRRCAIVLTGVGLVVVGCVSRLFGTDAAPPRVVILGFDGFDANLARLWMDEGRLPHLKKLADAGTFAPMPATIPSNSPSACAVAMTGRNAGATGLFDFVGRTFDANGEPMPVLSGVRKELIDAADLPPDARSIYDAMRPAPTTPLSGPHPVGVNDIAVPFFWERPEFPGFVGLRVPCAVPPRARAQDRVLAGLFMPDVAGGPGFWGFYTNDEWELPSTAGTATETGGRVFKLFEDERHGFSARLFGPEDFPRVEALKARMRSDDPAASRVAREELEKLQGDRRASVEIVFAPDAAQRAVEIRLGDERFVVAEHSWSPWFHPVFELTNGYRVVGLVRFYVNRCSTLDTGALRLEVYHLPISLAPRSPGYPSASAPVEYAGELANELGDFATIGWRTATNAMKDGKLDARAFLGSVEIALEEHARLLRRELAREDWQCLFLGLGEADQAGHMLLEAMSEDPRPLEAFGRTFELRDALREVYAECDRFVGDALAAMEAGGGTLLVVSDHGIAPFLKEADVVRFLMNHRYSAPSDEPRSPFFQLDWSKTTAYALGLGGIRLNLAGREPRGIVRPEDRRKVLERLRADLLAWTDGHTGAKVVNKVWFAQDIFRGDQTANASDVILGFAPGYRIGWQNSLGATGDAATPDCLRPQTTAWSADHCSVDPAAVPGFFASNRKLAIDGAPSVLDLAPTVYAALGLPIPQEFEGRALYGGGR